MIRKYLQKIDPKIDAKIERLWARSGELPQAPVRLPSVVKMKKNNLQNTYPKAFDLQKTYPRRLPTDIAQQIFVNKWTSR